MRIDDLTARKEVLVNLDELNGLIADLDAPEQAIVDIYDIDTVHAIQARKKVLMKK